MENRTNDDPLAALERRALLGEAEARRLIASLRPDESSLAGLKRLRAETSALEHSVRGVRATIAQEIDALARQTDLLRALGMTAPPPARVDFHG